MLPALRQPKWLVALVVVLALSALFVRLGFWQLERLEERRVENRSGSARFGADPVDLGTALADAGGDLERLRYRRVTVTGVFDAGNEMLIRSQVHLGQAGFHVITPLRRDEGQGVLVNRGWVPLTEDEPPVDPPPPEGEVEVTGWVSLTQPRPPLGREDPPGNQQVLSRVDVGRIAEQLPYPLAPVYVVSLEEGSGGLPAPARPPDLGDEGPHLGYAIQWFGFAAIGVVGFYFLLRRKGVRAGTR